MLIEIAASAALLLGATAPATGVVGQVHQRWEAPAWGCISDEHGAIEVGRAIWLSMYPKTRETRRGSENWFQTMIAKREGDTWVVFEKLPPNEVGGGGPDMRLDARDCHVISAYAAQ